MPKILNTNGNVIINTKAWFERFDVIRYSASEPDREVALSITDADNTFDASSFQVY